MNRRRVSEALRKYGPRCAWCGIGVRRHTANIVNRPAGPLPLCSTCLDRYEHPDIHPYLRRCLEAQGR